MRVGISLTSNYPDVKDPRQGARCMIERAEAARRAALDSLFVGDQHISPTPYYQNTPMLARLLAEWGEAPAGCLFLLPLWHPVLVAEQIGTLAAIARRDRRPEFDRLLKEVVRGKIDVVAAWPVNRLGA
jgi:alkanesulfonate monooxygenase SsuD/methylene tetrahydromethanopterin reductase-like flavin-dependent oxidoreductase (luciferase family)